MTEYRRQRPGTPFRDTSPRSANSMPDPATSAPTVAETSTSLGRARAATRAPIWTAIPPTFVAHQLDLAGMDPCADLEADRRHRVHDRGRATHGSRRSVEGREEPIARGVDLPAPVSTQLGAHQRVVPLEQLASRRGHRAGSRARVDPTMSVKSTVASTRSRSGGGRTPVRNSSTSSRIESASPEVRQVIDALELDELRARDVLGEIGGHGRRRGRCRPAGAARGSAPGSSAGSPARRSGRSCGSRRARCRAHARAARTCPTSAGTARPRPARAPLGAGRCRSPTHRRSADRSRPSIRGSAPRDIRRAAGVTRMTHRARAPRVRSGYDAANRMAIGPACDIPKNAADDDPTASRTARRSSICVFHRR